MGPGRSPIWIVRRAEARAVPKPLADPEPEPPGPTQVIEPAQPPSPPSERRTIQIGERPGRTTPKPPASPVQDRGSASYLRARAPRLAAAVALALFVLIVVVVLLGGVL